MSHLNRTLLLPPALRLESGGAKQFPVRSVKILHTISSTNLSHLSLAKFPSVLDIICSTPTQRKVMPLLACRLQKSPSLPKEQGFAQRVQRCLHFGVVGSVSWIWKSCRCFSLTDAFEHISWKLSLGRILEFLMASEMQPDVSTIMRNSDVPLKGTTGSGSSAMASVSPISTLARQYQSAGRLLIAVHCSPACCVTLQDVWKVQNLSWFQAQKFATLAPITILIRSRAACPNALCAR